MVKVRTFHSRKPGRPSGRRILDARDGDLGKTLCGAEPTEYDVARGEAARALKFSDNQVVRFEPCPACLQLVEQQTRRRRDRQQAAR